MIFIILYAIFDFLRAYFDIIRRLIYAIFEFISDNFNDFLSTLVKIIICVFIGLAWFQFHGQILTSVDQAVHCKFKTYYEEEWQPLLTSFNKYYDRVICWTNALGHWSRLFTGKFLIVDVAQCTANIGGEQINGGFMKSLESFFESIQIIFKALQAFFFGGLGDKTVSFYVIMVEFQAILPNLNKLLICICETIYIIYDFITRILGIEHLACALHQYGNGLISLLQIFGNYGIDFVTELFSWFFSNGSFQNFINLIFRQTTTLGLPNLTFSIERFYAGSLNFGAFLDDVILVIGCTIASEIDFPSNYTASHQEFNECYAEQRYFIPIFIAITSLYSVLIFPTWAPSSLSLIGFISGLMPFPAPGYRLLNLGYTFIINLDKVFDPNQFYLRDEWKWEWITDSLYDPPRRYDRLSTIWTTPLDSVTLNEYNEFGIYAFNASSFNQQLLDNTALLYGYYNTSIPTCNISYHSFKQNDTFIPCEECSLIGNYSFEYRMCKLGHQIDFLLFNLTGSTPLSNGHQRRLFQTFFCGFIPKALRFIGAAINWPVNFVRNWNDLGVFLRQDQWFNAIFDEFGGTENELGGLLKVSQDLFVFTFDPNLEMIINLIVLPAKAISEWLRSISLLLPRTVGSILGPLPQATPFNTTGIITSGPQSGLDQTLTNYLCFETTSPTCIKLESSLQWIRIQRQYPINISFYTTNFNATTAYRPILPTNSSFVSVKSTFVDNVAKTINLQFISLFVGYDILNGFDLSCGIVYILRAITEAFKFIESFVIISLETLGNYLFNSSTEANTFLLMEWFVCATNNGTFNYTPGSNATYNFYCSNVVDLLSDLEDFLKCPCVFFLDIEVISNNTGTSGGITLNCLCDLTTSFVLIVMSLIRAALAFAYGIIKIASCLIKNSPPPFTDIDCENELSDRFIESFTYLDQTFDYIVDLFSAIGCILGNIFGITNGGKCIGGILSCSSPQPPECTSSYYLALAFQDLAGILVTIIQVPINVVINLLKTTLLGNTLTGFPTSFVQFVADIVLDIAIGLWGDQNASPSPSEGFLQHFGRFLTCTFGPLNCELLNPNGCSGNLFILIGNNLRQYFTLIYCAVFNSLFFLETLIFGTKSNFCVTEGLNPGGQCAQAHLEAALKCFFELLFTLLFGGNSGTSIVDFIFTIIKAIVGLIPDIGDGLVVIVDILQQVAKFILDVVGSAFLAIVCVVTFGQICPSKKRNGPGFDYGNSTFFKRFFPDKDQGNSGSNTYSETGAEWWNEYYESTKQYHEMLKEYLKIKEMEKKSSPKKPTTNIKTKSGSSNYFLSALQKRFTSNELQTGLTTSMFSTENTPMLFNETEFSTVTNMQMLLSTMDTSSFCFRTLNSTIPKIRDKLIEYNQTGYNPQFVIEESGMSLPEEILFRICYAMVITPQFYNAASRGRLIQDQINAGMNLDAYLQQNPSAKRQSSGDISEYAWGTMPANALYSPLAGLEFAKNLVGAFGYYIKWRKEINTFSSFTLTPQTTILDLDPVKDISTPIDLTAEYQNSTLSSIFISSSDFLTNTIPSFESIVRKRSNSQPLNYDNINSYLADKIVVGLTFDEYLKSKGISCDHTISVFKGIDNFVGRQASLNFMKIKSTSVLMTMQYEFTREGQDASLLNNPQFGGDGMPISDATIALLPANTTKKRLILEPTNINKIILKGGKKTQKVINMALDILKGFIPKKGELHQNQYKTLNKSLKNIFTNGVNKFLIADYGLNVEVDSRGRKSVPINHISGKKVLKTDWFKNLPDHIYDSPRVASKKLAEQLKHLPIFQINGVKRTNNIRVPIVQYLKSVLNITYNTLILQYYKTKQTLQRNTKIIDPKNPWNKFSKDYVMSKLKNTTEITQIEKFYYQSEILSQKVFSKNILQGTFLENIVKELKSSTFNGLKRQSGFGFNTSCFILDDFISTV